MRLRINSLRPPFRPLWALLGVLTLALGMTAACGGSAPAATEPPAAAPGQGLNSAETKVRVVTTLYPLEYFARRIGGDTVDVLNLVAPGVEAHDFEPTPSDIRTLDSADVFIYNGAGLEPWIDRSLEAISRRDRVIVEASSGLATLDSASHHDHDEEDEEEHDEHDDHEEYDNHDHGPADPHVWLDPLKAIEQAKMVRDALAQANPAQADRYQASAADLIAELEALHQRFQAGLSNCLHRVFVTSHSAFTYLADRYGLEQDSISGITPEAEPSARDLARLSDRIRDLGVRYVMMEVIASPTLAQTVAREAGAQLLALHPLESLTPEEAARGETYLSVMERNLENLRTALECS